MSDNPLATAPGAVAAFFDATNAGDTPTLLALFTEMILVDDVGRLVEGFDAVRAWNETNNIGVRNRFTVREAWSEAGEHHVAFDLAGDGFNGSAKAAFVADDVSISRIRFYV